MLPIDLPNTDVFSTKTETILRSSRPHTAEKERAAFGEESVSERTTEQKHWIMQKLAQRSYSRGYGGL